ncbi:MAG: TIGR02117 family protein [Bacteroidota bacterium]|nr:TIGR02117 family protein [Bacteroidota bacterium]
MNLFKRVINITWKTLLGFVIFTLLYISSSYILSRISVAEETSTSKEIAIYIHTNGVHTDIVVPVKNELCDWSREIKFENTISKDTIAGYVAFGWGDKGFYLNTPTWAQLKFSVAFKAAFALSTSAIHATFYKEIKENADCIKIMISREQYGRLIKYIQSSFKPDSANNIINIKTNANYNRCDAFYEAKGKYNLFYTCNTWANNALKACGQKACLWTPFDSGIFYQYRK